MSNGLLTIDTWTFCALGAMNRKLTRPSASMRGYCTFGKFVEEGLTTPGFGSDATGGGTISGCFVEASAWANVVEVEPARKHHDPATAAARTRALAIFVLMRILLDWPQRIGCEIQQHKARLI